MDLVATYSPYLPTGLFRLGEGGLSREHVTHQFGVGAAMFFDAERRFRVSALASYDLNHRKFGIDIRRGDTEQVQGGAGALLIGWIDVGIVASALWQVRDDVGADVPPPVLGARPRDRHRRRARRARIS